MKNIINNIVFYKKPNNEISVAVFHEDGKVETLTYQEGLKICVEIAKEKGIKSKEAFKALINTDLVHVVSEKKFKSNYENYKIVSESAIDETLQSSLKTVEMEEEKEDSKETEKTSPDASAAVAATTANTVRNADDFLRNEQHRRAPVIIEEKEGLLAKLNRKIKEKGIKGRIAAIGLAAVVGISSLTGIGTALSKTKTGKVLTKNLKASVFEINNDKNNVKTADASEENNGNYDNYTFEQLQAVEQPQVQKDAMKRIYDVLNGYNVDFANHYVEEGKDIKAALTFREVTSALVAYNDFTPEELRQIFNGTTMTSKDMDSAYKTFILQVMGAHVIEDRANPVDMSGLLLTEEGKAFYEKYRNLFLDAKEATGDAKIAAVEKFYTELRKDFPITAEVREEGIAHADPRNSIESYKLSIVPMVAAGEMMWQNLEIDHTLQGGATNYFLGSMFDGLTEEQRAEIVDSLNNGAKFGEIDYFNDLGLCNYAEDKFEIVQQITMGDCGNGNSKYPTYTQYENAIVKELTDKNAYVIDDAHRDLSMLDKFQDTVNWHFEVDEEGYYTGKTWYSTNTYTRTKTWKKSKTTYRTEVRKVEKEIPASEKAKIDKQIEKENKKAKAEGEKKAEENRQEMQKEEDKKAEEVKKEVEQDAKDMQDNIDKANDKINENNKDTDTSNDKPVNESDIGHGTDFDSDREDGNGNLNDSQENITTDGSDSKTYDQLPSPEDTEKDYEERTKNQVQASAQSAPKQESAPAPKQESAPAPKAEPAPAPKASNEAAVDKYVEDMAKGSSDDDSEKTLVKE